MKTKRYYTLFSILIIFGLILFSDKSVSNASSTYSLVNKVNTYNNSIDAKNRLNPVGTYNPGTYYIYKESIGMINISKIQSSPGSWINPTENNVSLNRNIAKKIPLESPLQGKTYYTLLNQVNGYGNSNDALYGNNSTSKISKGNYLVITHSNDMLLIKTPIYASGIWINPTENLLSSWITKAANPVEFLNKVGPIAQKLAYERDLYASVMIAQSMLETGYGTSLLSSDVSNNYFGIKGYFEDQALIIHTFEYNKSGEKYDVISPFKKYNSIEDSILDYVNFITGYNNPSNWRYNHYYGIRKSQTKSFADAANYLTGRYATAPEYGTSLINLIKKYDLTKFDNKPSIENVVNKSPIDTPIDTSTKKETPPITSSTAYNGWVKNSNNWNYVDKNGNKAYSKWIWTPILDKDNKLIGEYNWKYFDSKGNNIDQFYRENGKVWLSQAGPTTKYYRGWWTDPQSGFDYYFRESSGTRVEGRQYIDGGWMYFRKSGTVAYGWQFYLGSWKYNDPNKNGHESRSIWKWLPIQGKINTYNWKYFNANGESINQFFKENGKTWLSQAGPTTEYRRGWWTDPNTGYRYYFRLDSGTRVEGKQFIDNEWKYFRLGSGTLATGWQYVNNVKCYFDLKTGRQLFGNHFIDGKWHYLPTEYEAKNGLSQNILSAAQIKNNLERLSLSNVSKSWSFTYPENNTLLEKYRAYYKKNTTQKVIYLTFDNGYEYNNYTSTILDILKRNNVKATFFTSGNYLSRNPQLSKRIVNEGHNLSNHTNKHLLQGKSTRTEIINDIKEWENISNNTVGLNKFRRLMRPPGGSFSEESLYIADKLGYETIFWNFAYHDWDTNNQPNPESSLKLLLDNNRNGSILLLHSVSQTNVKILEEYIKQSLKQGYTFKLL